MKKMSAFVLTFVGVALVLILAVANLELVAVLAGAFLVSTVIKRMCGPMADSTL
jgi:hypothetical protein